MKQAVFLLRHAAGREAAFFVTETWGMTLVLVFSRFLKCVKIDLRYFPHDWIMNDRLDNRYGGKPLNHSIRQSVLPKRAGPVRGGCFI